MKKKAFRFSKRFCTFLLAILMVMGTLHPISSVLDLSTTASAAETDAVEKSSGEIDIEASGGSYKSGNGTTFPGGLSVGDKFYNGSFLHINNTVYLYVGGSKVSKTIADTYTFSTSGNRKYYKCTSIVSMSSTTSRPEAYFTLGEDSLYAQTLTISCSDVTYPSKPSPSVVTNKSGATVTYHWSTGETSAPSTAGTYTVYATTPAKGDYAAGTSNTVTVTIEKAAISPTITGESVKLPAQLNPTLTGGNPGSGGVTWKYRTSPSGSWSNTKPTTVGTYDVQADVAETTNYKSGTSNIITLSISAKDKEPIDPVITGSDVTYPDQLSPTLKSGNPGSGAVAWKYRTSPSGEWGTAKPTTPGKYDVQATVGETDDYLPGTSNIITLEIKKAPIDPNITVSDVQAPSKPAPKVSGNPGNGKETFYYSKSSDTDFDTAVPTEPGQYYVYATVAETTNYESGKTPTKPFKITAVATDSDSDSDSATDSDTNSDINAKDAITVYNIDEDDTPTVTAYKIIKGEYEDGSLKRYVLCDELGNDLTIADFSAPTEDEIAAITAAIRAKTISPAAIEMTRMNDPDHEGKVKYTTDASAGLYVVVVTNSKAGYIYNPAVVAVNVDKNGDVVGGSVDMTSYFDYPNHAYIKSSKVTMDKYIVLEDGSQVKGTTAAYGETVNFRITNMIIPSYSHDYTNPVFKITDSLKSNGFIGVNNLTVMVDGSPVAAGDDTYTVIGKDKDGNSVSLDKAVGFEIVFNKNYLYDNDLKSLVIEYSSVIADTAGYSYAENQNTAKLEFSNDPDNTFTVRSTTYHYTLAIGGDIDGEDDGGSDSDSDSDTPKDPIIKVSEDCSDYDLVTDSDGEAVWKNKKALAGAEFALYNSFTFNEQTKVRTAVSDEYGRVRFFGLKAGRYYLQETNPPEGYELRDDIYLIDLSASFDDIGIMSNYTINIYKADENGNPGEAVKTASYTNDIDRTVNDDDGSVTNDIITDPGTDDPLLIINTDLPELPTTGGVGTILLTVAATVGMAYFMTMYLSNRRNKRIKVV